MSLHTMHLGIEASQKQHSLEIAVRVPLPLRFAEK
jgi:hypothetical protein